jgi:hypothetical protein
MKNKDYSKLWLMLVHIKAKNGSVYKDLVDMEGREKSPNKKYLSAWANILVKGKTINEAIDIAPKGLAEKSFDLKFIDKVENFKSLVEHKEVKNEVIKEATWLLNSKYVFKISEKIFPYTTSK